MSLRRHIPLLSRATLVLLFVYAQVLGATTIGILLPEARMVTLCILLIVIAGWLFVHWRLRWSWHRSALDLVVVIWGLALLLSLLSNLGDARAILIAMWYAGIYIGIAYVLLDLLANRAITRQDLVKIFLLAGALVIIFGYIQVYIELSGGTVFDFRRSINVRSLFINANALATFLILYLILLLGQIVQTRALVIRILLVVYFGMCAFLMFLTSSRGAWLATAAGLTVWLVLHLIQKGGVTFSGIVARWRAVSRSLRLSLAIVGLIGLGFAGLVLYSVSFKDIGDKLSERVQLLRAALTMFSEKPLTGYGLSSYGWHMTRFWSVPANQPYKNAHNFPANVAAELGIVGLIALVIVMLIIIRTVVRNWRSAQGRTQAILTMTIAAATGYAVHHLFDLTSAAPMIAMLGTVLLVIILAPNEPIPINTTWQVAGKGTSILVLWLLLLVSGLWDAQLNLRYMNALDTASSEQSYAQSARNFQPIVDADLGLVVYPAEQAYLWGLAANEGDVESRQRAIEAYERVIKMAPYYAPYRANLAALYEAAGRQEDSLSLWQQAVELAPQSWQMHFNLAQVAEKLGMQRLATEHYTVALDLEPDADLHPAWGGTALQQTTHTAFADHSPLGQVILRLEEEQPKEAALIWQENDSNNSYDLIFHETVWTLIALANDDRTAAEAHYAKALATAGTNASRRRLVIAEAALARDAGEETRAEGLYAALRDYVSFSITTEDGNFHGADIAFYVYYRQVIVRQFLPQVFYPGLEPVALYRLMSDS